MTQTLDLHERAAIAQASPPLEQSGSTSRLATAKFGTFAITFGIAFAVLYTAFERLNWPLFTYHPAVGKLDFWYQAARRGEGPPMYWYGWLMLAGAGAFVLAWFSTMVERQWLYRATIFGCVLAALWPACFALAVWYADQASFDADFLKSVWLTAIPGFIGAALAAYLTPGHRTQRVFGALLLLAPVVGLIVLAHSLLPYFQR